MPVVQLRQGPHKVGPKDFPAPKRASLRAWWNAARKVIGEDMPPWNDQVPTQLDDKVIIWLVGPLDIFISRKGRLR